jgi:hypothetical protein
VQPPAFFGGDIYEFSRRSNLYLQVLVEQYVGQICAKVNPLAPTRTEELLQLLELLELVVLLQLVVFV